MSLSGLVLFCPLAFLHLLCRFSLQEFHPKDVEILSTKLEGNNSVFPTTRNKTDRGIPCSSSDPDIFLHKRPSPFQTPEQCSFSFYPVELSKEMFPLDRMFVKANRKNKRWKSETMWKSHFGPQNFINQWKNKCQFSTRSRMMVGFVVKNEKLTVLKSDVALLPLISRIK